MTTERRLEDTNDPMGDLANAAKPGLSGRPAATRQPKKRSKSEAAAVGELLKHLPKGLRPSTAARQRATKPRASARLMARTARGAAREQSRDLELYVLALERRKEQAQHMKDRYTTLDSFKEAAGVERKRCKHLMAEQTKIRKDSILQEGKMGLLVDESGPKRPRKSIFVGASKIQEDMDELETKIVIKARLVNSLTALLARNKAEWAETSKHLPSQAAAKVGAVRSWLVPIQFSRSEFAARVSYPTQVTESRDQQQEIEVGESSGPTSTAQP